MISNQIPSRTIPKNYRNITGKVSSKKSDHLISYESKLERDFIYLFEFDLNVKQFLEQPVTIKYIHDAKKREYTPDFYIETYDDNPNLLIEVKYKKDLKKKYKELKHKLRAAIEYAENHNLQFKIFTDKCPKIKNSDYLFNIHFLLKYNKITYENYKIVKKLIPKSKTVQDLLNKIDTNKYEQASFINNIWALVRYGIISINLDKKITTKSTILSFKNLNKASYEKIFGKIPKKGLFR